MVVDFEIENGGKVGEIQEIFVGKLAIDVWKTVM